MNIEDIDFGKFLKNLLNYKINGVEQIYAHIVSLELHFGQDIEKIKNELIDFYIAEACQININNNIASILLELKPPEFLEFVNKVDKEIQKAIDLHKQIKKS